MRFAFAICLALIVAGCTSTQTGESPVQEQLSLVPFPSSVTTRAGSLLLDSAVAVKAPAAASTSRAAVQRLLSELAITASATAERRVDLSLVEQEELGTEGYRLEIDQHIRISANTDAGLFYGVQTLRQLLPASGADAYTLPLVVIEDTPQYPWRGAMLDVARSFLPVDYLKAHIDRMALFKLNKLHLHLSDDQGWRVEIKQYPRLAEIGGASAVKGGRSGVYTQAQLKDLVAYAAARNVDLIPEIDLPGHTQAALASYNDLACDDVTNLSPYSGVEVGFSKLCLTEPDVIYPWVRNVLQELVDIFPSEYIHIGGDEIKDPLYGEFIARAAAIVDELGRTPVAWEEASVAETRPDMLLQLWNDNYDIQPALERGHRLVLSPCSYTYFDHGNYAGQPDTYVWCRKEGVPLDRAYSLNPEDYSQVVGVEAAMWSELVHDNATADNRLWPRMAATAEVAWTRRDNRNFDQFVTRMNHLKPHLDALGVNYYAEPKLGW